MQPTQATASPADFYHDIIVGLAAQNKALPSKYLYDQRGSALFDDICKLKAYYPTRTELGIMTTNAQSIANQIGKDVMLVEYGSGSSVKTRILLDYLDNAVAYVPVDISEEHLLRTADVLRLAYPDVEVLPLVADFTKSFCLPSSRRTPSHTALYFPGSTIGNFTHNAAGNILLRMSRMLGPEGGLLIGIDLQKDKAIIEEAYNDRQGVTAAFNLNLLTRINHELDADFDLNKFHHQALYNDSQQCIEISIVSDADQAVQIGDQRFEFRSGEEILTEYSHKYTVDGFASFASQFGFALHRHWTDDRQYFAVLHLVLEL